MTRGLARTSGRPLLTLGMVLAACISEPTDRPPRAGPEPSPTVPPSPVGTRLPVIAVGAEQSILDGLRLGADQERIGLDVMTDGRIPALLRRAIDQGPPAILVVASLQATVDAVIAARPAMEAAGVPVVVLGADLYSRQALHRHLFQTSIPLSWQARVLAHYLATDRGYDRVISWDEVAAAALREEGVQPLPPGARADAGLAVVRISSAEGSAAQLALPSDALLVSGRVRPGTVACYPYTWAGWADMIPRVHRFRTRFEAAFGHPPSGFEQEGYDAVRAVAEALERTGGAGGERLIRALESFREKTYSSIPIRLGPDDHVLAEESQLGLFAVDDRPVPAGETQGALPWRPVMRTFTTDGQKVNLLDRDKKVFFPAWTRRKPSPRYWRSRFGIVTRPDEDPLH